MNIANSNATIQLHSYNIETKLNQIVVLHMQLFTNRQLVAWAVYRSKKQLFGYYSRVKATLWHVCVCVSGEMGATASNRTIIERAPVF